jgi:hypothetical protein
MLRKRSCAEFMAKERSRRELISLRWSFLTLLTGASCLGRFLATTRRPLHGRGLAEIRLASISARPSLSLSPPRPADSPDGSRQIPRSRVHTGSHGRRARELGFGSSEIGDRERENEMGERRELEWC